MQSGVLMKRNIRLKQKAVCVKRSVFYGIVILVFLFIVASFYCDLADYQVYFNEYYGRNTHTSEIGYTWISSLFFKLGLPFEVFYAIYMLVFFGILFYFYHNNLKKSIGFAILLTAIFPYINYLQQIRSAMGMGVILLGLCFIDNRHGKLTLKTVLGYLCTVGIAMTFHITSFAYIVFLIVLFFKERTVKWLCVLAFPITVLFVYIVGNGMIVEILQKVPFLGRLMSNFIKYDSGFSKFRLLILVVFYFLFFLLFFLKKTISVPYTEKQERMIKYSYAIIALSNTALITSSAYRLSVIALPIVYATIIEITLNIKDYRARSLIFIVLFFVPVSLFGFIWGPFNPEMNNRLLEEMWRVRDLLYVY